MNSGSYNQSMSARMLEVDAEPQIAPYVYKLSSSGPRQDPWETPHFKWMGLDKMPNTQSPSATKFWRELVLRRCRNTSLSMEYSQRNAMCRWHQCLIRSQNKGQTAHCLFILMLWLQATYHLIFYKHKELVPGLCCFLGPAGFEEFLKSGHQSGLHWLEAKTRVSFWILKYTMFRYHSWKN